MSENELDPEQIAQVRAAIDAAAHACGSQAELAHRLGTSRAQIMHWRSGQRPVPIKACVTIERLTGGAATRKQLRPDDWPDIWPELS
ncbi:transcriptional regulator [Caballeronia sp. S22]|jgi:DNA-binding transcriptional regulator YdaS (Cro superfamily)|uniref:transcriptional regulator n=1 Tax=Caballeronia sp. S22 TaxID=3137182 RepID=UPI00353128C1